MKFGCVVVVFAALAVALAAPADARAKHRTYAAPQCVDRPLRFSWDFLFGLGHPPAPTGCAEPVYEYGKYIGQDPDPNVRYQLRRDPGEGDYSFRH
jgi:hypothetical protein